MIALANLRRRRATVMSVVLATVVFHSVSISGDVTDSAAQPPPTKHVGANGEISATTLVKAGDGTAAIRVGVDPIETVKVGDLVGKTKAAVKEVSAGRLVLEEVSTGKDGKPNRALIIIKEGERGGTRYLQRNDAPPAIDARPVNASPASPYGARPAPKKPPQM